MAEVSKNNSGVNNKGPQQMSSSLKERLKRCGRYYSSPSPPTKLPAVLPTPDSMSSPTSLNSDCNTSTINRSIYETPPCAILTPSSSDSGFDDSTSLSCTPVLKARDSQGSQPRVKRLRLSSRAFFKVNLSLEDPPDVDQREGNAGLSKEETRTETLNGHLLEEDSLQITAHGDGQHWNSESPEENLSSGACLLSGDDASQSQDKVLDYESQGRHSNEAVPENLSCEELLARKLKLQKQLKEKHECLRKLRMVKLYRSKNDLSDLDKLVEKWRGVSQQVLLDLHQKLPEPKPSLSGLLQHLHIDQTFLRFNPEEETFD